MIAGQGVEAVGKEKTRYIPFGVYEYEYMEAWL